MQSLTIRHWLWIALLALFVGVGFPEQFIRTTLNNTPVNASGVLVAILCFALFVVGKNPLDRWFD